MGQISNKTYTAPDSSVFRVEADGSVTKIKNGRVQSNESPSKYNITPDGKIYRVESDGTVTYLGNAEDRRYSSQSGPLSISKKSVQKWCWIILVILVSEATIVGIYLVYESNLHLVVTSEKVGYADTVTEEQKVDSVYSGYGVYPSETTTEKTTLSEEVPAFYPGDIEGNFYGVVEGLGRIRGLWSCGSQMGGGFYCVDDQNESSCRDLYFINEEPLVWYESIDHGNYYESTGTWYFDYFNGTTEKIATGIYVRGLDNRRFPFTFYRE